LVRPRLEVQYLQHGEVGAHGTGAAVLEHDVRVATAEFPEAPDVRPVVAKEARTDLERVEIGPSAGCHVVIELEETNIEISDEAIESGVQVCARSGMA
jgi:hypothetical protein